MKISRVQHYEAPFRCERALFINDQKKGIYPPGVLPRCMHLAMFMVDGRAYCHRHAKDVVFEKVLNDQEGSK